MSGLGSSLAKQRTYIRHFRSHSWARLAGRAARFGYDYYLGRGRAAPPMNLALFVTARCDRGCVFCNLGAYLAAPGPDPTFARLEQLIAALARFRPSLTLFGGEPFMRRDIPELAAMVRQRYGLRCNLFTNGILITADEIDRLCRSGLDAIVFSISSLAASGTERALANLRALAARRSGISVIMQAMLTPETAAGLEALVMAGLDAGAGLVRLGHPTYYTAGDRLRVAADNVSCQLDPTADQAVALTGAIARLKGRFGDRVIFHPPLTAREVDCWYAPEFITSRKCLFAWVGAFILPNGDVIPCESFNRVMGNVYQDDFLTIWNSARYVEFRNQLKCGLLPGCARCCKL